MADINVRSDSVDVEQIMRQIRSRIREKRGVDYTEAELQQLAQVKLERFLDPKGLRSDLVEQYRRQRAVSPAPPNYEFEAGTLFDTHRGLLKSIRQFLRPILKLFFNPDKITSALHIQSAVNAQAESRLRRLEEREPLSYELLHNLTLEITRLGIEVQNLRMRQESISSRLDFDERRARSLEGVVQYRPEALKKPAADAPPQPPPSVAREPGRPTGEAPGAEGGERKRRRRRRRRRPGQTLADRQEPGAGQNGPPYNRDDGRVSTGGNADPGGDAYLDGGDDGPEGDSFENGPDDDADADDQ